MNRDLHNNVKFSRGLSPVAATTDNTAYVSQIIDTANFNSTEFIILTGSLADADATFAVLVEDGNNSALSDNAEVAAAFLLGTEAGTSFTFAADDTTRKIGYIGAKRYVRVTITPANNTGNVFLAGVWAQAGARTAPQA
ncbi:MAG: hypothetical protein V4463_05250 [Pseudomonadota bacterium]